MIDKLTWAEELTNSAKKLNALSQRVSHQLIHSQMKTIAGNLHGASTALRNNGDAKFIASQLLKMFNTVNQGGVATTARFVLNGDEFEQFEDIMLTVKERAESV